MAVRGGRCGIISLAKGWDLHLGKWGYPPSPKRIRGVHASSRGTHAWRSMGDEGGSTGLMVAKHSRRTAGGPDAGLKGRHGTKAALFCVHCLSEAIAQRRWSPSMVEPAPTPHQNDGAVCKTAPKPEGLYEIRSGRNENAAVREPARLATLWVVGTGSAEQVHLQPGIGGFEQSRSRPCQRRVKGTDAPAVTPAFLQGETDKAPLWEAA